MNIPSTCSSRHRSINSINQSLIHPNPNCDYPKNHFRGIPSKTHFLAPPTKPLTRQDARSAGTTRTSLPNPRYRCTGPGARTTRTVTRAPKVDAARASSLERTPSKSGRGAKRAAGARGAREFRFPCRVGVCLGMPSCAARRTRLARPARVRRTPRHGVGDACTHVRAARAEGRSEREGGEDARRLCASEI